MKIIRLIFALGALVCFQTVYADDLDDAKAAYNKGDHVTAFHILNKLAEQGLAEGQYQLGAMYGNGLGVTQDYVGAVKWYRKAAEQGHAKAQRNLGVIYGNGLGVTQDYVEAVKWYRKAAEQGHAGAQQYLGVRYTNGQGVTRDYVQSHAWFTLAASQGDKVASENSDKVSNLMTPDQIAEAQALAREWAAKYNKE